MASKDMIAKEAAIATQRLTETSQVIADHLGIELPAMPIHPRFGQDHLRAKQLTTFADWLDGIEQAITAGDKSKAAPEPTVTPGAQAAMDEHGLTAEQVMPEGGKITKREVDAYLAAYAEANPLEDDDSEDGDEPTDDEIAASESDGEASEEDDPEEEVPEEDEE